MSGERHGRAGAFLAVLVGVALLTASALVLLSPGPSVPARYAGTEVLVRSAAGERTPGTFGDPAPFTPAQAARLTGALAGVPGVRAVVADRSFPAQAVIGGRPAGDQRAGDRRGFGWSGAALAPYPLSAGRAPRGAHEVVVDEALGVSPGASLTVLTAAGPEEYTVSGTVADAAGALFFSDARAERLAPGVRLFGLLTEPGADPGAVARAAGAAARDVAPADVLTGAGRDALAPADDERTRWIGAQVLTALTALSGFATVLVVASVFSLAVVRRRREFALLRIIGATPRQVRRMLLGGALRLGAAGSAAGAAAGAALAPALGRLLSAAGLQPPGATVEIRPWVVAAAGAAGVGVALAGAWAASRRAGRVPPLAAWREGAADDRPLGRGRRLAGLGCLALGGASAAGAVFAGPSELVAFALVTAFGLIAGAALLAPVALVPLARLVTRPAVASRRTGAVVLLAREGMLAAVRRTATTAAPVLATVGFVLLISGSAATTEHAYETRDTVAVRARGAVVPDGTPGLSDAAVSRVPGASPLLAGTVYAGDALTSLPAYGVDPEAFRHTHGRLTVVRGDLSAFGGPGTAVVGQSVPLDAAGEVRLRFEDGRTRTVRAVAVVPDAAVPAPVLLPRATVRAHDPAALTGVVFRTGGAPVAEPALGARETTVAAYAARVGDEEDRLVRIFTLLLVAVSAGYTGLSVATLQWAAGRDRAADLRVLRLSGATPRQVLATVAVETAFVVALGAALGALAALPSLLATRAGLSGVLGVPVDLVVPWQPVAGTLAACALTALGAALGAARRTLRATARPADALTA